LEYVNWKINSMKITIKKTMHGAGHYAAYRGAELFATISGGKPTTTNGRADTWNVCWLSGRVDWFPTLAAARDAARKG
jgi:hypothetical protein